MKVITLIDSLIAAGAERMAVNIANGLSEAGIKSHLCATHSGGPLEEFIAPDVRILILQKRSFMDYKALWKLRRYIRTHRIEILHAHSSSVFWAVLIKMLTPGLKVVWHDHYGYSDQLNERPRLALRVSAPFVDHAFVVNDKLRDFAIRSLKFPPGKVSFLANFADINTDSSQLALPELPSPEAYPKLVCLANLRPQKDHHNLLNAFSVVKQAYPNAALYLVGGHFNDDYHNSIVTRIENDKTLNGSVHVLGSRNDVADILTNCHIGILSSLSEGLPVSLLEYGLAALPVVCTKVGDCEFVLDNGTFGKLVEPSNSQQLADAIIRYASHSEEMTTSGQQLRTHILRNFSKEGAILNIKAVYSALYKTN